MAVVLVSLSGQPNSLRLSLLDFGVLFLLLPWMSNSTDSTFCSSVTEATRHAIDMLSLIMFFVSNFLKWKRQAKELVGTWATRQSAPDSSKMGPWHAVLEVLVLPDLQHVRLPFWQVTKPTICKENTTNAGTRSVYVSGERVEFPFYTPVGNFYKPNLDRRLTSLSKNSIASLTSAFVFSI